LPRSLGARAGSARADLNLVAGRLRRELLDQRISRLGEKLAGLWAIAELSHPDRPLGRGFARVTNKSGQTLIHARDAREAQLLTLRFGDGALDATVDEVGNARRPVERKPRRSYIASQPGLFDARED
jgi:exodeoxyribonuclease VII large subunit